MYAGSVGDIVEEDARVSLRRLDSGVNGYELERNKATDAGNVLWWDGGSRFSLQTANNLENAIR